MNVDTDKMVRERWLEERRGSLGASDVAAVLGCDPRRGPLAVYEAKVLGYQQDDTAWMAFGRHVEMAIAEMFRHKTGKSVVDCGGTTIRYHDEHEWLSATLDRIVIEDDGERVPLELKSVDPLTTGYRPETFGEEPPLHYLVQLQTQIAVVGATHGYLAAYFPGYRLEWIRVERNENFLDAALPVLREFWCRVERRDPPPPDCLPGTLGVVKRMYPLDSGETVDISDEIADVVELWQHHSERAQHHGKALKQAETIIRAAIGEATYARLPSGEMLSLKTTKRKGYTLNVEPTEYRTLRRMKTPRD